MSYVRWMESLRGGRAVKNLQKAIKKPGALRKSLGIKKGEKIPLNVK